MLLILLIAAAVIFAAMLFGKRALVLLIGLGLAFAMLAPLPAQARDTTWGCPGCAPTHHP